MIILGNTRMRRRKQHQKLARTQPKRRRASRCQRRSQNLPPKKKKLQRWRDDQEPQSKQNEKQSLRRKDLPGRNLRRRLRKRRTYQILTFWIHLGVNQCQWCRRKQFRKTAMVGRGRREGMVKGRSTGSTERKVVGTNQPLRSSESLRSGTKLQRKTMDSAARRSTFDLRIHQRLPDNLRKVKREGMEQGQAQRPGQRLQ